MANGVNMSNLSEHGERESVLFDAKAVESMQRTITYLVHKGTSQGIKMWAGLYTGDVMKSD